MHSTLQDQAVAVTGASKGIGLACVQTFAAAGAKVALVARSRPNFDAALTAMSAARHAPVATVAAQAASARGPVSTTRWTTRQRVRQRIAAWLRAQTTRSDRT